MLRTRNTKVVITSPRRRGSRLARHDEEAGGVVRVVLDVAGEHVEAVDLGRELGGERPEARLGARGEPRRGAGAVDQACARRPWRSHEAAAWPQQDHVRPHPAELLEPAPRTAPAG